MALGGSVFEVTPCLVNGEPCVKKCLALSAHDSPLARAALLREASFLALASHPSLPRLVEVGTDARGPFVVEEAMLGLTLTEIAGAWEGRIPIRLALHVAREAALSLSSIHDLGDRDGPLELAHGDPSFDNVIVSPAGKIAFVDFGEAAYRGASVRDVSQSGTPPYAAPEVLRGEALPSRATDTYALAAVVIALVTGKPLRPEGEEAARLVRLAEDGIDLSSLASSPISDGLRALLGALVAVDPGARRGTLRDLVAALDR